MPDPLIPLAKDWIPKLLKAGAKIWIERREELEKIFNEFGDCELLAKSYIEPDCQPYNPADRHEDEPLTTWLPRGSIRKRINEFLKGEFLRTWLTDKDHEQLDRARRLILPMRSLRMRPMLLAYAQDLMESEITDWREYSVYEALVDKWLLREERKPGRKVTREQLLVSSWRSSFRARDSGLSHKRTSSGSLSIIQAVRCSITGYRDSAPGIPRLAPRTPPRARILDPGAARKSVPYPNP